MKLVNVLINDTKKVAFTNLKCWKYNTANAPRLNVTSYKSGYNNLSQKVSEKAEKEETGRKDFTFRPKTAYVQNRICCPQNKNNS